MTKPKKTYKYKPKVLPFSKDFNDSVKKGDIDASGILLFKDDESLDEISFFSPNLRELVHDVYEFYDKDVYPRKIKYHNNYDPKIHNTEALMSRPLYEDANTPMTLGYVNTGKMYAGKPEDLVLPIFLNNHPFIYWNPVKGGNWAKRDETLAHEVTHAEDVDWLLRNGYTTPTLIEKHLGQSMSQEEQNKLRAAYKWNPDFIDKTDPNDYITMAGLAELQTTNRELRYNISKKTGLTGDALTKHILNLTNDLVLLYMNKYGNAYLKDMMIMPTKNDSNRINAIKKALIEVAQNNTPQDPYVNYAAQGGPLSSLTNSNTLYGESPTEIYENLDSRLSIKSDGDFLKSSNVFRDGGKKDDYYGYMEKLAKKKSKEWNVDEDVLLILMLNDNTYNYKAFYDNDKQLALLMLTANPEAHFSDIGKTVYHPTFSNESMYSGKVSDYNPRGTIGGSWNEEGTTYTVSSSLILNKDFNYGRTRDYLRGEGIDIIVPNKKANGGPISKWEDMSMKERHLYIKQGVTNGLRDINSIREYYNNSIKESYISNDNYTGYALGGVINQDNPILNYSVVKEDISSVRYDYGGDKDNSFTEAAWDVAKILDPTGILSWKDAYRATKDFVSKPSWGGAGKAAIEIAGALPVVGKAGKALKIGTKVAKYGEAATKVGKAIDTAANIGKVPGKIVLKTTVKPIITSTINTTKKGIDKTKQVAKQLATEDDAVGLVLKPSVIDKASSARTANDIMGVGTMEARTITKGTDLDYNLTNGIVTKPLFSSVLGNTGGSYNPIVAGLGTVARTWTDDNSYNGSYLYGYPDKESNRYSGNNRGDINILGLYIYGHPNLLFLYDILPVDTMYIPQSMANTLEIGKRTLYNTDYMDLNLGYPSRTLIDAKHFTGQWDKSGDTGLLFTATDKFDLKGTTGIFGDIVEDIITNDANAGAVNFKLTIPVVTVSDDDSRGLKTVKLLNSITEKANGGIINNTISNTIYSGHIGMSRL